MNDAATASTQISTSAATCLTLAASTFVLGALHPTFPWILVYLGLLPLVFLCAFDLTSAIWKRGVGDMRRSEWFAGAVLAVAAFAIYSVSRAEQEPPPPIPEAGSVAAAGTDWYQRFSPDKSARVSVPKDWNQQNSTNSGNTVECRSPGLWTLKAFVIPNSNNSTEYDASYWADYVVKSHSAKANSYRALESTAGRFEGLPYAERIVHQSYDGGEDVTLVTVTLVDEKIAIAVVVCHPQGYLRELPVLRRIARSVRPNAPTEK